MTPESFDAFTRGLALGAPRRVVLKGLIAGITTATLPWARKAEAAPPNAGGAICRGDGRCVVLVIDTEDASFAPGICHRRCFATAKAVQAGLRQDWRQLARALQRRGFRLKNRYGKPTMLLTRTAAGQPLAEKSFLSWIKAGGEEARLILNRDLRIPGSSIAYATVRPHKADKTLLLSLQGRLSSHTVNQITGTFFVDAALPQGRPQTLGIVRPASAAATSETVAPTLAAPSSGFVSTALCTSSFRQACNLTAVTSCEILVGNCSAGY